MALLWVGTGAVLLGVALAVVVRRPGILRVLTAVVAAASFLVCCFWLSVPSVHALSTGVDLAEPTDIECGSALGALDGSPFVLTDEGRRFNPAQGACQATAWGRVATLGSTEAGLALVLGAGALLVGRRSGNIPGTWRRQASRTSPAGG